MFLYSNEMNSLYSDNLKRETHTLLQGLRKENKFEVYGDDGFQK